MRVKELRQRLGWTQARLAAKLGVEVTTVQNWEHGRARPSQLARRALSHLAQQHGLVKAPAETRQP